MRHVVVLIALLGVCGCDSGTNLQGDAPDARDGVDGSDGDVGEDVADVREDAVEAADEVAAVCGNGVVESGEECDDGTSNSDTEPDACRTSCTRARCGDDVADTGEECDGFLNLGGRTCLSLGHVGGGILTCGTSCRFETSGCRDPVCGNGFCELGETETGCPADCSAGCGNGTCEDVEDQFGCQADCGTVGISAGYSSACVVLADGTVRCWGGGYGATPVAVDGLEDVLAVDADPDSPFSDYANTACAVRADGTVVCWDNGVGGVPAAVMGLSDVVSIERAMNHGCAVAGDGTVRCWGYNNTGELGNGTSDFGPFDPTAVPGLADAVSVSTGGFVTNRGERHGHSCAVLADGTIRCWGANGLGQLGAATTEVCYVFGEYPSYPCSTVPMEVRDIHGAVAVATTSDTTCAVLSDGTARCWGKNGTGELGEGTFLDSATPVAVAGLTDTTTISGAPFCYLCGLSSDGTVSCWGGVDGRGEECGSMPGSATPAAVPGVSGAVSIGVGENYVCAALSDGTAWCWGNNRSGQLGDGTTTDSNVPVQVAAW